MWCAYFFFAYFIFHLQYEWSTVTDGPQTCVFTQPEERENTGSEGRREGADGQRGGREYGLKTAGQICSEKKLSKRGWGFLTQESYKSSMQRRCETALPCSFNTGKETDKNDVKLEKKKQEVSLSFFTQVCDFVYFPSHSVHFLSPCLSVCACLCSSHVFPFKESVWGKLSESERNYSPGTPPFLLLLVSLLLKSIGSICSLAFASFSRS